MKQNENEASDWNSEVSENNANIESSPQLLIPVPMSHTQSLHDHVYIGGCIQFAPSLASPQKDASVPHDENESLEVHDPSPLPLQRTLSTPEPYRPLRHRANSAFGHFRSTLIGTRGKRNSDYRDFQHHHSDPGVSAFHPVNSKSLETSSTVSFEGTLSPVGSSILDSNTVGGNETLSSQDSGHNQIGSGGKKISPPRLGSKLLSGIKGALKGRTRRMSGRENPVSLLAEEEEEELEEMMNVQQLEDDNVSRSVVGGPSQEEGQLPSKPNMTVEGCFQQFDRSNSKNNDMYSDSDLDDDIMEPIVGQYHLLDDDDHSRPNSVDLSSVEVVATPSGDTKGMSLSGVLHVLDEMRPVDGECGPLHQGTKDSPETSTGYHPLMDDNKKGANHDDAICSSGSFPLQLTPTHKSPHRKPKPSSPDVSQKSSSPHSRTTATSDNSQADYEVRETNRLSSKPQNIEEVVVDMDGNATVHSSSTSSSNYHYVHSPKIREGAMPGERFFAATPENITSEEADRLNIGSLTLSHHKSENRDIMEQLMERFPPSQLTHRTQSPHTVSSASISNTSSSGSETKKPLKFVAIKKGDKRGSSRAGKGIIKPRIYKSDESSKPPIQTLTSYQKPPQSPCKDGGIRGGARTPTRTPPPRSEYGLLLDRASTPCSPPVIMDGPIRDGLSREGTRIKPHSVRRASGGMILHHLDPVSSSIINKDMTIMLEDGANDGAQEVISASLPDDSGALATIVTPEKPRPRIQPKWGMHKRNEHCKEPNIAKVSPEKNSLLKK